MYKAKPRSGLMLGFGGFAPEELEAAVMRLRKVMDRHGTPRRTISS